MPTDVKDSQQIIDKKTSHSTTRLTTIAADAIFMYNNTKTLHAVKFTSWWLDNLEKNKKLPPKFSLEAVKDAMIMIMRNNVFEWGAMYFLQLLGTAIGTLAAVMWATIHFAYNEVHQLIPVHGVRLFYFKRFIDNIFGVWTGNVTTDWQAFYDDVNDFEVITWDIEANPPSRSVNFLGLILTIEDQTIVTKNFQKEMDLFLYLSASSAHPQGCLKGAIYILISRYFA